MNETIVFTEDAYVDKEEILPTATRLKFSSFAVLGENGKFLFRKEIFRNKKSYGEETTPPEGPFFRTQIKKEKPS